MSVPLIDNLSIVASAPDGIKKVRELILELAVRGKLVPQDPNDEPASVLLKRIQTGKERLIKAEKLRKEKPIAEIVDMEQPYKLPETWTWVRLGQIGDWGAGATPLRSKSEYYYGTIPWFKSGELDADLIFDSEEKITELALKECSLRENKAGDVLIAMYGATIGKTAILAAPSTTNQAVCACTPFDGFYNRFLLVVLKALKPALIRQGAGGAQPNISREKIIATVIGLPPADEQQRIVAKVDELMALCDRLEAQQANSTSAHIQLVKALLDTLSQSKDPLDFATSWHRIKQNFATIFTTEPSINALKQALLQLGVMGKLVPQDPNDEPASELLKRIETAKTKLPINEKKKRKINAQDPQYKMDAPYELPINWEWTEFRFLLISMTNGLYKPEKFYTNEGVVSLRMYNIREGKINFQNVRRVEVSSEELAQYELKAGDILINRVNSAELVGKAAVVPNHTEPLVFESMNMRLRLLEGLSCPAYLNLVLLTDDVRTALTRESKQAISQASLNQGQIGNLQFPLPPLAEQHRIVAKVEELMVLCDRLKASLSNSRSLQELAATTLIEQAVNDSGSRASTENSEKMLMLT